MSGHNVRSPPMRIRRTLQRPVLPGASKFCSDVLDVKFACCISTKLWKGADENGNRR